MKDHLQNDRPAESTSSTDQIQQPSKSKQQTPSETSAKGVFIRRAKGQSFEEFKEFCVKRFREAGLIKD